MTNLKLPKFTDVLSAAGSLLTIGGMAYAVYEFVTNEEFRKGLGQGLSNTLTEYVKNVNLPNVTIGNTTAQRSSGSSMPWDNDFQRRMYEENKMRHESHLKKMEYEHLEKMAAIEASKAPENAVTEPETTTEESGVKSDENA